VTARPQQHTPLRSLADFAAWRGKAALGSGETKTALPPPSRSSPGKDGRGSLGLGPLGLLQSLARQGRPRPSRGRGSQARTRPAAPARAQPQAESASVSVRVGAGPPPRLPIRPRPGVSACFDRAPRARAGANQVQSGCEPTASKSSPPCPRPGPPPKPQPLPLTAPTGRTLPLPTPTGRAWCKPGAHRMWRCAGANQPRCPAGSVQSAGQPSRPIRVGRPPAPRSPARLAPFAPALSD
jgi:hypothetical protein